MSICQRTMSGKEHSLIIHRFLHQMPIMVTAETGRKTSECYFFLSCHCKGSTVQKLPQGAHTGVLGTSYAQHSAPPLQHLINFSFSTRATMASLSRVHSDFRQHFWNGYEILYAASTHLAVKQRDVASSRHDCQLHGCFQTQTHPKGLGPGPGHG